MPEIVSSQAIEAKELFIAKKINSRLNFLNLKLENNKKNANEYKNDKYNAFGIYFMFFKKKLIYIGSWSGNGLEAKDSVVKERLKKHIINVTTRFLDINFLPFWYNNEFGIAVYMTLRQYFHKNKEKPIKCYLLDKKHFF